MNNLSALLKTEIARFLNVKENHEFAWLNRSNRATLDPQNSAFTNSLKTYKDACAQAGEDIGNIKTLVDQEDSKGFLSTLDSVATLKEWSGYFPGDPLLPGLFGDLTKQLNQLADLDHATASKALVDHIISLSKGPASTRVLLALVDNIECLPENLRAEAFHQVMGALEHLENEPEAAKVLNSMVSQTYACPMNERTEFLTRAIKLSVALRAPLALRSAIVYTTLLPKEKKAAVYFCILDAAEALGKPKELELWKLSAQLSHIPADQRVDFARRLR